MYSSGLIGTSCPARYTFRLQPDGTVLTKFFGLHNHDVQSSYRVNFINPLQVSSRLRNLVDRKLLAGVTNAGKIAAIIRDETRACRDRSRLTFSIDSPILTENVRNYELSLNLDTKKVLNRRNSLGLRDCYQCRMDHDDHKSVWKIVEQWKQHGDTPVRYYKPAGVDNDDTSETVRKGDTEPVFGKKDFLLVMQSREQAQMMQENSRLIFVDETHGLTGYGYYLMSIVVADRHGTGLLVGEAITSRENHRTWELFAKNLLPMTRPPEVMMSDDTNSAWNGLRRVGSDLKSVV